MPHFRVFPLQVFLLACQCSTGCNLKGKLLLCMCIDPVHVQLCKHACKTLFINNYKTWDHVQNKSLHFSDAALLRLG